MRTAVRTTPDTTPTAFYRYRGTLADAPVPRPGRPRSPLAGPVLEVIAGHGGEASATEIRAALEESGIVLSGRRGGRDRVPDVLRWLSKAVPPAVVAVGDPRGGRGKAQRWRLERAA